MKVDDNATAVGDGRGEVGEVYGRLKVIAGGREPLLQAGPTRADNTSYSVLFIVAKYLITLLTCA